MNDRESLAPLRAIGLTEHEIEWAASLAVPPPDDNTTCATGARLQLRRVVEVQRDHVQLHDGHHTQRAQVKHALLRALADEADALAVGDWVLAAPDAFAQWWVCWRAPPRRQLARRLHDGRDKVERVVLASNVETALLVMGLDADFNRRRLMRYLGLARLADVQAVVVLTKADGCPDVGRRVQELQEALPGPVSIVALDARDPAQAHGLDPWLRPGHTLVMLGSSGAGKSTLTNSLCGQAQQLTGSTREHDGRGRHTTTVRRLHALPGGACIIDTPGLRSLRLDSDESALAPLDDDIARLAPACRYRDCRHESEPGCAVRGAVPAERLRQWHKLCREAQRDSMSALERQRLQATWKLRARAAKARANDRRTPGGEH